MKLLLIFIFFNCLKYEWNFIDKQHGIALVYKTVFHEFC